MTTDRIPDKTGFKRNLLKPVGFLVALVLIVVASHFIGLVAGRWAEQEWELNAGQ